jgi:hypothetical protein
MALGLLAAGFGSGPLAAADLVSHRAYYSLKLAAAQSDHIIDVRGVTRMSLEKTCDGWILGHEMSTEMDTSRMTIRQVTRFAGWESRDGNSYRFAARNQLGRNSETFKGRATLKDAGEGGAVTHSRPADKTFVLPPGTMFPISHLDWLVDQANAGARQASRIIFDGNDGKGPRQVVAFIGPRVGPGERRTKDPGPLAERPGWSMRLAFYPVDSTVSVPEYEIQVVQLDNGIADALVLDYGSFKVNLNLEKVEALPPPAC